MVLIKGQREASSVSSPRGRLGRSRLDWGSVWVRVWAGYGSGSGLGLGWVWADSGLGLGWVWACDWGQDLEGVKVLIAGNLAFSPEKTSFTCPKAAVCLVCCCAVLVLCIGL